MKNLQISKLLSVALLVSVTAQAVAVPSMEDVKNLLKPYPNRASHRNARECEFDVYSQEAKDNAAQSDASYWTKAKAKLYRKPAYCFTTHHPYLATAGKYYVAMAAVVYGAYKLYKKCFGKAKEFENLDILKAAAQSIVEAYEKGIEAPILTVLFTDPEVEALINKVNKLDAQALVNAVSAFDRALGVWAKKPPKGQKSAAVKRAQGALNKAVDACNKVLEAK